MLAGMEVQPLKPDTKPMDRAEQEAWLAKLYGWQIHHARAPYLVKEYKFPNFAKALAFVNRVGELAEAANHHPDIELGWGRVEVKWWTHDLGGLHQNDFILAAKVSSIANSFD